MKLTNIQPIFKNCLHLWYQKNALTQMKEMSISKTAFKSSADNLWRLLITSSGLITKCLILHSSFCFHTYHESPLGRRMLLFYMCLFVFFQPILRTTWNVKVFTGMPYKSKTFLFAWRPSNNRKEHNFLYYRSSGDHTRLKYVSLAF